MQLRPTKRTAVAVGAGVAVAALAVLVGQRVALRRSAHRPAPLVAAPAPPEDSWPALAAQTPHGSSTQAPACEACHVGQGPSLRAAGPGPTCRRCHASTHPPGFHPIGISVPAATRTPFPLESGRVIGCGTCHDPHARGRMLLRGEGPSDTCVSCHPRL